MSSFDAIRALVDERALVLVTGKGGTGKSTLVAALATLAARRRGSAVAVELSAHPRLPALLPPGGAITTATIDAEASMAPALGRLLGLPAVAGAILDNRVLRLFMRTSPAIREMIVLDELAHVVERASARRAPVFVDLHATGHALSLVATPQGVREMLRVGPLAGVASRVHALLSDPRRCELLAVTLPEELPVNETIELLERIGKVPVASRAVVVNQMPEPPVDPADRPLLDTISASDDGALRRLAVAARAELESLELARAHVARLRDAVTPRTVVELPRLAAPSPRHCVAALAEVLAS